MSILIIIINLGSCYIEYNINMSVPGNRDDSHSKPYIVDHAKSSENYLCVNLSCRVESLHLPYTKNFHVRNFRNF